MPVTSVRLLAFLATLALVIGTWIAWIDSVSAANLPMRRLIGEQMSTQTESFPSSVGVLIVVAAVLGLVGVLLPSPMPAFVGALLAIIVTLLLLVQEYQEAPGNALSEVVGSGVWTTGVAAGVLLLVSFALTKEKG